MKVSTTEHHLKLWMSKRLAVLLEFKPQDLWIGVFWKRATFCTLRIQSDERIDTPTLDVWVCVIPMLPIHVCWWGVDEVQVVAAAE